MAQALQELVLVHEVLVLLGLRGVHMLYSELVLVTAAHRPVDGSCGTMAQHLSDF